MNNSITSNTPVTHGVLVPMITPTDADGQINVQGLKAVAQAFIEAGVAGLVVCGTTGEYYTFSDEERELVLSTVAEVAKGKVNLVAGINDLSTAGSIEKAKRAKALGYDGLMLAPPAYSLPEQAGIIEHFKAVAEATDLPIIMYHFPVRTGVEMDIDTVLTLAKEPNIVGIKESSGDLSRALHLMQADTPNFDMVCGCDDQAADFLFWGAKGWISGAANVFPAEQVQMMALAQAEDWQAVKDLMLKMYPAIYSMESADYNQKAKLGAGIRHGVDVGGIRLPLVDLTDADKQAFEQLLKEYDQ